MIWTDASTEQLKALYLAGMSAADIGLELGATRNAVIGKIGRLDLPPRERPSSARKNPNPKRARGTLELLRKVLLEEIAQYNAPTLDAIANEALDAAIPAKQRRTLMTLAPDHCRWPVGNPCDDDFFFCGAYAASRPYCSRHRLMAYPG
jgi:GcrA cell cycle regulator